MSIKLNNIGSADSNVYYPRLMVNYLGEIILATRRHGRLTTGILVGKTAESVSKWELGKRFNDWEVAGSLRDYDGPVNVTFENMVYESL